LPLVHPQHGMRAPARQQRQVGERAKAPVSDQNIPELEDREKNGDALRNTLAQMKLEVK